MTLRDYQEKAIDNVLESFQVHNSVMLQMPTGTGKTVVFSFFLKRWIENEGRGKRVLFLVHRKELVHQIMDHLKRIGLQPHHINGKVNSDHLSMFQVHVGTVQSLQNPSRLPKNLSLIVIDEAHHTPALSYRNILEAYKVNDKLKILGVTATPQRLSGENFQDLFEKLILSDPIKTFQEKGYLSWVRHFVTSLPDLTKITINAGDYAEKEAEKLMLSDDVMADLIESYEKYALGKKMIVFASSVKHSLEVANRYSKIGKKVAHIDGKTSAKLREELVGKFKIGDLDILCNVNVFTEGFDCPDVEVVQLARPTKSLTQYLQMVGRVMRPFPGKQYGLILDNARLFEEHGLCNQKFIWNWEGGKSINEKISYKALINFEEGVQLKSIQELKGLELVEVSDDETTNINFEISATNDILNSKKGFDTPKRAIIDYNLNGFTENYAHYDKALTLRIRQPAVAHPLLSINSEGRNRYTNRNWTSRELKEFNFQVLYLTLIDALTKMCYSYSGSISPVKSIKHTVVLNVGEFEIKLHNISNHFFIDLKNYHRMRAMREAEKLVDFSVPKPKTNQSVLNDIHPQFNQFIGFLYFGLHSIK